MYTGYLLFRLILKLIGIFKGYHYSNVHQIISVFVQGMNNILYNK